MARNLYVLFQLSWCAAYAGAGIAALVQFAGDPIPPNSTLQSVMVGCLGFAALGLLIEARRGLYSACMFLLIFSLLAGAPGLVTPLLGPASPIALGMLAVSASLFIPSLVYVVRSQSAGGRHPDVLAGNFGKEAVLEYEGVQLVTVAPAEVDAGSVFELQLFLQNCWSGPRTFELGLVVVGSSGADFPTVQFDQRPRVVLGPLEVGELTIPIAIGAGVAPASLALEGSPSVAGMSGMRQRVRRLRFSVAIAPAHDGLSPAEVPTVRWRRLWSLEAAPTDG